MSFTPTDDAGYASDSSAHSDDSCTTPIEQSTRIRANLAILGQELENQRALRAAQTKRPIPFRLNLINISKSEESENEAMPESA